MIDVELLYRQHLSDADRQLLASLVGSGVPVTVALGSPQLEEAVFGPGTRSEIFVGVSPFLAFATAVHRTAASLETATFVEERWAPRMRVPVFDVSAQRSMLADPTRRYFFVELLASYTRVTSGVTWTRTPRGWRRRRFSELDPVRLADLLEVVGATERPGVYRRLGDLSLFLLGVFPDHPILLGAAATERLLRLSGVKEPQAADIAPHQLLEMLGGRWYKAAVVSAEALGAPLTATMAAAGYVGEHFADARRVLNTITDRYLFPWRDRLFGTS